MGNTVVVGVDGSETALKAARVAARLAAQAGAPLHVVTGFDTEEREVISVGSDEVVLSTRAVAFKIAQTVAQEVGAGLTAVTTSAEEGKPADVILAEAVRVEAGLIVVGNRRMQGFSRVLGSVANSVVHHAPCDVYVVKTV
jgi:nucleotide-binding universal stress UspA family protein